MVDRRSSVRTIIAILLPMSSTQVQTAPFDLPLRQDLTIAEGQLRDCQARLGQTFPHEHYPSELAALQDQLKVALSGVEGAPDAAEVAGRIKTLRAGNTIEPRAERVVKRVSAEEPVTARILRREQEGEWERRVSEGEERKTERG